MLTMEYKISGKVQGVWYRASTKDKANELGLTGYAKNCADGTVLVIASGEVEQLKQLESWLWHGSQLAQVLSVVVARIDEQNFSDFTVR